MSQPPDLDRFRSAITGILGLLATSPEMVAAMAPFLKWQYRVVAVTPVPIVTPPPAGSLSFPSLPITISGTPINPACPFGPLANITLWPGVDGSIAYPAPGSLILVEFQEGSPSKPMVSALDPSTPPLFVMLGGASLGLAVARIGDPVSSVVITGGSTKVYAPT